jgi:hypothetical protein
MVCHVITNASSVGHVGPAPPLRLAESLLELDSEDQVALASVPSTDHRRRRRSRASSENREEEAMEEEQLRALLRDLDAIKQRPNDAAPIERVPSRSRPLLPSSSASSHVLELLISLPPSFFLWFSRCESG